MHKNSLRKTGRNSLRELMNWDLIKKWKGKMSKTLWTTNRKGILLNKIRKQNKNEIK